MKMMMMMKGKRGTSILERKMMKIASGTATMTQLTVLVRIKKACLLRT